jgi:hypothetical protein
MITRLMMHMIVVAYAFSATEACACSVTGAISNVGMVKSADSIVRAIAVEYASPPSVPRFSTTGTPDSRIHFKVVEHLRGTVVSDVVLPGHLVEVDDFNDQQSPYHFVRPNGRRGSCFADAYRSGGQFLLFLKRTGSGELTVNWYALAPVNEQLHSDVDPWLLWVREQTQLQSSGKK